MTAPKYMPPRTSPLHPPTLLTTLRAGSPISKVRLWNDRQVWLVTRYEDIQFILRDGRFSSDATNPMLPSLGPTRIFPVKQPVMSFIDEPKHGDLRRILNQEFQAKRMEELRPNIKRVVAHQLDLLLERTPPVDFHAAFSFPVPSRVVCELLGIAPDIGQRVHGWMMTLGSKNATGEEAIAARKEAQDHIGQVIAEKAESPTDDLLGRFVARGLRDGRVTLAEMASTAGLLIFGGHETTANTMSLGVLTMMLDPEWARVLREQPELAPNAVEEVLRFHTVINDGLVRIAKEDVRVGDTLIRAGDGLIVSLSSGNRDVDMFASPDRMDMQRPEARRHLTFGHGIHLCLGRWLARAELQIGLVEVAKRIPTLRLAVPLKEVRFREDMHVYGVHELPVTWDHIGTRESRASTQ